MLSSFLEEEGTQRREDSAGVTLEARYLQEAERFYPEIERTLLVALRAMTARCSEAKEWDNQGFNKIDAPYMHDVAKQAYRMTPPQANVVFFKLQKYKEQLSKLGIALPDVQAFMAFKRERENAIFDEQRARVRKKLLPLEELEGTIELSEDRKTLYGKWEKNVQATAKMHEIQNEVGKWRVSNPEIARVRFNWDELQWECPIEAMSLLQKAFPNFTPGPRLVAELRRREEERRRVEQEAEEARRRANEQVANALALVNNLEGVMGYLDGKEIRLFQHQKDVIQRMVHLRRFILAHDMGLGKTLSALVAAKTLKMYARHYERKTVHVLVIGPVSTRTDWMKSAAAIGLPIAYHTWGSVPRPPEGIDYIVLADEGHNAQNWKAQRTQKLIKLTDNAYATYILTGTPMKNGRPANIYPLLVAVKHPIAYPPDTRKSKFEKEFCGAQATPYSKWDVSGATSLSRLNKLLLHGPHACMEYKLKSHCVDLPPKMRVLLPAEISTEARRTYEELMDGLWERYESNVQRRLAEYVEEQSREKGIAPGEVSIWSEEERIRKGEALVALGILRHAGSVAKTAHAIEHALEIIEEGDDAPILFTAFKDTAEHLARAIHARVHGFDERDVASLPLKSLSVKIISGDAKPQDRARYIEEFQQGNAPAIVCLFGAGGVGVNLQRSANVILVDRPWTPGDAFQAEDRSWRIGQERKVTSYWMQLPEELSPIDVRIDTILDQKQQNINRALLGQEEEVEGITFLGDHAVQLLSELLARTTAVA